MVDMCTIISRSIYCHNPQAQTTPHKPEVNQRWMVLVRWIRIIIQSQTGFWSIKLRDVWTHHMGR